ncbi:hypothetical protein V6N11_013489 [Hibiscus sabdariffa]|uniref:Uncharacterized protein n=1 Tax=Hibiscus sabdariffa TaxID=183260 RepID=A0ABR2NNL7_9ROSI
MSIAVSVASAPPKLKPATLMLISSSFYLFTSSRTTSCTTSSSFPAMGNMSEADLFSMLTLLIHSMTAWVPLQETKMSLLPRACFPSRGRNKCRAGVNEVGHLVLVWVSFYKTGLGEELLFKGVGFLDFPAQVVAYGSSHLTIMNDVAAEIGIQRLKETLPIVLAA